MRIPTGVYVCVSGWGSVSLFLSPVVRNNAIDPDACFTAPGSVVFEEYFTPSDNRFLRSQSLSSTSVTWSVFVCVMLQTHFLPLAWELSLKCGSFCESRSHRDVSFTNLRSLLKILSHQRKECILVKIHILILLFLVSCHIFCFLVLEYYILILKYGKLIQVITSVKNNVCWHLPCVVGFWLWNIPCSWTWKTLTFYNAFLYLWFFTSPVPSCII